MTVKNITRLIVLLTKKEGIPLFFVSQSRYSLAISRSEMRIRMKIITRTWKLLRINFKEILLFEMLYRLAAGGIFFSLFTRGINLAVKYSGYSYLTAKNVAFFLVRPVTILVLLFLLVLGTVLMLIETSSLLSAFQASERYEKLPAYLIFVRGVKRCGYCLHKGNRYLVGMNLLLTVVFHYTILSHGIAHVKSLQDVVKNIGSSTMGSALVLILALVLIGVVLPGCYAIPFAMLHKKQGREAWTESWHLISRHTFSTVVPVLVLNLVLYAGFRILLLISGLLVTLFIYHFVSKSIMLALLLTTYEWLELGCLLAGSIFNMVCNCALLTALYYTARDWEEMAPELLAEENLEKEGTKKTWAMLAAIGVMCCSVCLYDVAENGVRFAKEVFSETEITAHRGSSVEAAENTREAVELAIEQLADYVEIDVQESRDGILILLHDKNFKRTCGVNANPWTMDYAQIQELNAASYMKNGMVSAVPTLQEILECCQGKINLNIELKNNGHDAELPDKVVAMVKAYEMEDQCVFTSTSLSFLERVKELDEELKTGYILSTAYGEFYKNDKVDFFSVNSSILNETNMAVIHERGQEIHAWTVNTKAEIERLKHLGVDNIITDRPVLVREILYREEDTENFLELLRMISK